MASGLLVGMPEDKLAFRPWVKALTKLTGYPWISWAVGDPPPPGGAANFNGKVFVRGHGYYKSPSNGSILEHVGNDYVDRVPAIAACLAGIGAGVGTVSVWVFACGYDKAAKKTNLASALNGAGLATVVVDSDCVFGSASSGMMMPGSIQNAVTRRVL